MCALRKTCYPFGECLFENLVLQKVNCCLSSIFLQPTPFKRPKCNVDPSDKDLTALQSAQNEDLKRMMRARPVPASPSKEDLRKELEMMKMRADLLAKHNEQISDALSKFYTKWTKTASVCRV